MTFSDFVLLARKRLHDYRDATGVVITDVATDGIRWSSAELQSVCKGALQEMLRTMRAMKLHDYIHVDVQHQRIAVTLKGATADVDGLPDVPADGFIRVNRITSPQGMIYYRVTHKEFDSKRWRINAAGDDDADLVEGVFVSYWDTSNDTLKTTVFPIPTADIPNCIAEVVVPLNALFTDTSTVELPFVDIDDILLDYAEMHGALIDHDQAQVKYIRELLNTKLQELSLELQKSNR